MTTEDILKNYLDPPKNWETTKATHYVSFPWGEDWLVSNWRSNPELERRENGDIATVQCASLWSKATTRPGGAEVLAKLGHKSLLIVDQERVGIDGGWHFVTVVNTHPEVDGLVGYILAEDIEKLPGIASSLPVIFKCREKIRSGIEDFCSFASPVWHEATEPYYDADICEYLVNVVTRFTDTGGGALEGRMQEQIPAGVRELLEFYDRPSDEASLSRLLNAFKFAQAKAWNLDLSKPSRLKVLVSVPARYFDAIGQNVPDLEDFEQGSTQFATLISSKLEKQVDALVAVMLGFHGNSGWKGVKKQYSGPKPFYGDYNFSEEAQQLKFFIANLKRLLVLNNKNLRTQVDDIIEIGFDAEYKIQYVMLNDEEGSHKLTIGFNRLRETTPFNYPRTMAYVFFLFEISNELNRRKEISGGWSTFLKKYTFPAPDHSPAGASKKCSPTLTDPLKCMGPKFNKYRSQHLRDIKCDSLPPSQRMALTELGELGYEAIQTGEVVDFLDPFSPAKVGKAKLLEEKDIATFKKEIEEENDKFGGSMDFVGDPFVDNLYNKLNSDDWDPKGMATEVWDKVYREVANEFSFEKIIALIHKCLCAEMNLLIEEAEANDAPASEIIALRLASAELGCMNFCGVIPILCSCIPIPWPPSFSIPDDWDIGSILGYLTAIIIDAILSEIINFLLNFIKAALKMFTNCGRKTLAPARKQAFLETFKNNYPWEDEGGDPNIAEALRRNEIPEELVRADLMNALMKDTVLLLSPREFCELINGDARRETLDAVSTLMKERHPDLYASFSNIERIRVLFLSVGSTIDPSICRNLDELLDQLPVEPVGYICEETDLRQDMAAGRATAEQINQMLLDAAKCNADKLKSTVDLANKLANGGDLFKTVFDNLYASPSNPNGIIPREPPSVQYLREVANDAIFRPVENRFYSDMNSNVPTMITTAQMETPPAEGGNPRAASASGFGAWSSRVAAGVDPEGTMGLSIPGINQSLERSVAKNFGTTLEALDPTVGDDRSIITLQVPPRRIVPGISALGGDIGSNFFQSGLIPGFPAPPNLTGPLESIVINYSICQDSPVTTNWSTIRDVYTVQMEDTAPDGDPTILLNFDGNKTVSDEFVDLLGDLHGVGAPSQEAFSNMLIRSWTSLPWNSLNILNNLNDPSSAMAEFHRNAAFKDITRDLVRNIAGTVSRSKFLDGSRQDFKEAFDNLTGVLFSPHPSCDPREPGILNLPEIRGKMTERYESDLRDNPHRYIGALQYGVVVAYIRVLIIQIVLDGIFPFSQFKAEDILKSDLTLSYFLNRMKTELRAESDIFSFNLWVETITAGDNFYEEVRKWVAALMVDRKYVKEEIFFDPFTNEEVEVLMDPRLIEKSLLGIAHDVDEIVENLDIKNLVETEVEAIAQRGPQESVNRCGTLRAVGGLAPEECVPETDSNANNETSSGERDPNSGKRTVGYFELFLREQLKSISGEAEVLFGTEINDINTQVIGQYARVIGVPVAAPIGPARFYKDWREDLDLGEGEFTGGDALERAGREDLKYLFEIVSELTLENERLSGTAALEKLQALASDPEATAAFLNHSGSYADYIERLEAGEDLLTIIQEELEETFLRPITGMLGQRDLLRPGFEYLEGGGFVVEQYIKITDLSFKAWGRIDEAGADPLAVEKIWNRDPSLKGIVNLESWQNYFRNLVYMYDDQLKMVERDDDGISLNFKKYFKKWEFGARLTYVYPTESENADNESVRSFIRQNLMNINNDAWNITIEEAIQNIKAYTIKERVNRSMVIQGADEPRLNNVPIHGDPFTFDVVTVPLVSKEIEIEPQDVLLDVGGKKLGSFINQAYNYFEEHFYSETYAAKKFWHREVNGVPAHLDGEVMVPLIPGLIHQCPTLPEYPAFEDKTGKVVLLVGEARASIDSIKKQRSDYSNKRDTAEAIAACEALEIASEALHLLQTDGVDREDINCYQVAHPVTDQDGRHRHTHYGQLYDRIEIRCQPAGSPPPDDVVNNAQPGAFRELDSMKSVFDGWLHRAGAEAAGRRHGTMWNGPVTNLEYDDTGARASILGYLHRENGYPQGSGLRRLLELTEKEFYAADFFDGITPIDRCFVDGNEQNDNFLNRRGNFQCEEFDGLKIGRTQLRIWISTLEGRGMAITPISIVDAYTQNFFSPLSKEIVEDPGYRVLFEYVFPLDRFMSLVTIYSAEHVAGLPGRRELFDETRDLLRRMYYAAAHSGDDEWWRRKEEPTKDWWDKPLELSIPGILFMTPFKILQALLILVPPLNWFLDMLLGFLPELPPHRSKRSDPCD